MTKFTKEHSIRLRTALAHCNFEEAGLDYNDIGAIITLISDNTVEEPQAPDLKWLVI